MRMVKTSGLGSLWKTNPDWTRARPQWSQPPGLLEGSCRQGELGWKIENQTTLFTKAMENLTNLIWLIKTRRGLWILWFLITMWDSLWLSCCHSGPHMKDGDNVSPLFSTSRGSERKQMLHSLWNRVFGIHDGVIISLQLIGEAGKWIFQHSWDEALSFQKTNQ